MNNFQIDDEEAGSFEIHDNEIDVEAIMRRIRENIQMRKTAETYSEMEIEKVNNLAIKPIRRHSNENLDYLSKNWNINNNSYSISSHRPITGKFLVEGRKVVNGEVRRYVDPILWKQNEFNSNVSKILEHVDFNMNSLENSVEEIKYHNKNDVRIQLSKEIAQLKKELKEEINDLKASVYEEIEKRKTRELEKQKHSEIFNYYLFGEHISNSWVKESGTSVDMPNLFEDIKNMFIGCTNVLDIGCGTGYFLKLLKDHGIGGKGIDINEDYIMVCKKFGLYVEQIDAITYLESVENKSIDGVFLGQVIEHLDIITICEILKACYNKMQYGSFIAMSTPNIKSNLVSSNLFYLDPTHKTHIHPEVMKFLLGYYGFRDIQEKYYQPVSDEHKLKKIEEHPDTTDGSMIKIYNQNIEQLNNLLYGHRDFVIIGKK